MRIYLDACCLSRLTDDQTQRRVCQEAEAVEKILKQVREDLIQWVSSDALAEELGRNPHEGRKIDSIALLALASETIETSGGIRSRARQLQHAGYGPFDALHLACAEAAHADVLLTTDDGLMRKASRGDGRPRVAVLNPLSWSQEDRYE
ncbi:MAG TPA: PIN domain-containing protein [Bryobacteraceae bacterium]|nr:PIN domain-containing protein [Bryobacteraceae bacterium]